MAETIKEKLNNCMKVAGTATMAITAAAPTTSSIAVKSGFNRVLSAKATYVTNPGTNGPIYRTISTTTPGQVTFYAYGNQDSIDIDYEITGIV